jgi:hypothetical protein
MAPDSNKKRNAAQQPGDTPKQHGLRRMEGTAADEALFQGLVDGLVVAVPSNEAPLLGLAGLLDWRFHGAISQFHSLTHANNESLGFKGSKGELTLVPLQHRGKTFKALLVGVGACPKPGIRTQEGLDPIARGLRAALDGLGWKSPGFSAKDWGDTEVSEMNRFLEGRTGLLLD